MQLQSAFRKAKTYLELLRKKIYRPLGPIHEIEILPCDYKTSPELPTAETFVPYESGALWGDGIDTHAWFRFQIPAYPDLGGKKLLLRVYTNRRGWDASNPQFLAYVDGKARQGLDTHHRELMIDPSVSHEVYLYAYTGTDVKNAQLFTELVVLDPLVEKLYFDIRVPFESLYQLDQNSYEYQNILEQLSRALDLVEMLEYEGDSPAFHASIERASRFMEEVFYGQLCAKSEGATKAICIGHTHIDCAWLWTMKQTREKVQRSFATVIELMDRYPEYRFMSSQPLLYQFLKEEDPTLYSRVKDLVKEGRWECEGAMWVEADCNLTSGESLVRQVLYGKRFFKDEFGVDCRVLWLPDVFGYSAALPQILRKSGVEWFVTSKISWNDCNMMPYDTFDWQGIDGSRIHSYFITSQNKISAKSEPSRFTTYIGVTSPAMVSGTLERYQQKTLTNEALIPFGYGDGGGGPTAKQLEMRRRLSHGLPGTPKAEIDFVGNFLSRLEKNIENNPRLPVWMGELYLEFHRGTYTSIHKNKKNNRQCEFLCQNAELVSSMAKQLLGKAFPKSDLHRAWEMLLSNQFHDIIPGSSIGPVYDQSDRDYAEIRRIGSDALTTAQQAIASSIDRARGYVVFNPNSGCTDGVATLNGTCVYVSDIPAKGYACVASPKTTNSISVGARTIENKFFRLTFDENMLLSSIYDKRAFREVLQAGARGNELRVYADYPHDYDAWEWTEYSSEGKYTVLTDVTSSDVINDGARAGIRITRRHMDSTVTQTVWLYDDIDRIDFETDADWHQKHQMLKAAFPVNVNASRATYEIQYGSLERPTHKNTSWDAMKFETCAHKFADLSEGGYGVSLLNDCKYGHDIHNGVIQLSLLRSPAYPYPKADEGRMQCVYALVPHVGALDLPRISAMAYALNNPMQILPAVGDASIIPEQFSAVTTDKQNVVCEVVKECEDGDDTILRLYENGNTKTTATVTLGFDIKSAYLCDMMEREISPLEVSNNTLTLEFGAFEIHTIKLVTK